MEHSNLLNSLKKAWRSNEEALAFHPFPDDVSPQKLKPRHRACAAQFQSENGLRNSSQHDLITALHHFAPSAHWRDTYSDTNIGDDFLNRFGCFDLVGENAPFNSQTFRLWMVYMPAHLHYPWHHHPAEEMYLVVAGQALFMREGQTEKVLQPGATCFHKSNQSHSMTTQNSPVLCLVGWRNEFETPPVLTF